MLIDGSSEIALLTLYLDDDLTEMPLIASLWPLFMNLIDIALLKFETSPSDRFVGDRYVPAILIVKIRGFKTLARGGF